MRIAFESLRYTFCALPYVKLLVALGAGKGAYLVGGAVRDALSGLAVTDIDLVFPDDPTPLAKDFARQINGHWFWLDESRLQSRVVLNNDRHGTDFDFAPFRAATLGQDLLDRDFTINAMALPLTSNWSHEALIDPLCGLEDLQDGVLRMASDGAFVSDPLRILKGIRHATVLGLTVEEATLKRMQQQVAGLYHVAVERIRNETWKLFASDNAPRGLHLLCESLVGNYLFGNKYSDLYENLQGVVCNDRDRLSQVVKSQPVVKVWLSEEIEQGLSCENLLLWTRMLVQLESDLPVKLADEWMLCRKAKANIKSLAGAGETLLAEFACLGQQPRSFALWALKHRVDPRLLLLFLLVESDINSELHAKAVSWVPLVESLHGESPAPLVSGHWLRSELGLQEGPEMKTALELLAEAEICGEVASEKGARSFLVQHYENID